MRSPEALVAGKNDGLCAIGYTQHPENAGKLVAHGFFTDEGKGVGPLARCPKNRGKTT